MRNKLRIYSTGLAAVALVLFLILVSSAVTAAPLTITESRITTDGLSSDPAIDGNRIAIVFTSNTENEGWTSVYDLSTKEYTLLYDTWGPSSPICSIQGNKITWSSGLVGVYDFSTKDTQYLSSSQQAENPKIYGNKIVWENYSNAKSNIYMHDLSTNTGNEITTSGSAFYPDIYIDKVVWQDKRNGGNNIYMYDFSTSQETLITTNGGIKPEIYGERVVWSNGDVHMYDLSTKKETQITTSGSASDPQIYGDRIVWQDSRSGNSNIYMYDLSTNTETQITTSESAEEPDIYGDRIVWQDGRNGGYDIYMATLSYATYPAANFSSNVTTGTAPLNVAFTDKSTGSPTAWNWSFGDGTANSTAQNPTHTYSTAGNYTVTLTVTNSAGSNTVAKSNYITSTAPTTIKLPVIYFWASRTSGTVPVTIGFTDASTNTPTAWFWDFGDGTNSTLKNPRHTYTSAGTYSITLTASNAGGSATKTRYNYITLTGTTTQKPVASFTSNVTSGKVPLSVLFSDTSTGTPTAWNWNFGDGTANATVKNPVHVFSKAGIYTVTLTASNSAGSSTIKKSSYITASSTTPALVANFSSNVTTGTAPLNVAFTDKSTGTPTAWNWSFGDGTYSTVKNPAHLYSKSGNYTVKLTVKNATGSTNSITKTNYIKVATPTTAKIPVVSFWASRTSGTVPITIGFTDASTNTPTAWKWNFGDGTYSTLQNPRHAYSKAGTYSITLTASNAAGSATKTRYNYIILK